MDSQIKRITKLLRKTGDKLIVLDSNEPEDAYAIMSLNEYEKISENKSDLRGLTEDEMIDKINRDIALWKNEPEDDVLFSGDLSEEEEKTEEKPKKRWSIPEERKKSSDEIIEEDRQYLEEVDY
jgi:hypothetical protein